jgi:cholesterol transport system auxiliary component
MLPSQAHFTLRAHLVDTVSRQVVAWREFDAMVPATSEDPYGSVLAANSAVRSVIKKLVFFCRQTAMSFSEIKP